MPSELPIACSLNATELPRRLAEMGELGSSALQSVERSPTIAALHFRRGDGTRERLKAIVAAEASCCAFLDMTLRDSRDALVLTISAPPDAALVLDELVAAFAATPR